jgi:neutral ceramidase
LKKTISLILTVLTLLLACGASAQNVALPFKAGAARIDITPANVTTTGNGKYAHERFYLRAIVIDNGITRAAIISEDAIAIHQPVWEAASIQIAKELDCPVENIIMAGTHTHSISDFTGISVPTSASGAAQPGQGAFPGFNLSPAETESAVSKIMEAVRTAKAKLEPARLGFGSGQAYLNVNRDAIHTQTRTWYEGPNLKGTSDKTVAVLKFERPNGELIAAYVNYAMHPISMALTGVVSADFCGAVCRYIEQVYDDKPVVAFSQGASGDQAPMYLRPRAAVESPKDPQQGLGMPKTKQSAKSGVQTYDAKSVDIAERFVESEGQILGEEVLRIIAATNVESNVKIQGAEETITCPGRRRTSNSVREGGADTYEDSNSIKIKIGALRIGSAALTRVNAEVYTEIGQEVKANSPTPNTMMITLANGESDSGYIPTDAAFGTSVFEVMVTSLKPGCAETSIVNGMTEILQKLFW